MSARRRHLVFVAALAVLIAGAALIVVATRPDDASAPRGAGAAGPTDEAPVRGPDAGVDEREILARLERELRAEARVQGRREARAELGPRARHTEEGEPAPRGYPGARERAEAVARRFWLAFARYELGQVDRRVERELRATAAGALARELVSTPPRVPGSGAPAAPARLGRVRLVADTARSGRLMVVELVGDVSRGGARTPLSIALRRTGAGWRVEGLGR